MIFKALYNTCCKFEKIDHIVEWKKHRHCLPYARWHCPEFQALCTNNLVFTLHDYRV